MNILFLNGRSEFRSECGDVEAHLDASEATEIDLPCRIEVYPDAIGCFIENCLVKELTAYDIDATDKEGNAEKGQDEFGSG
jgi:hypothetical protein